MFLLLQNCHWLNDISFEKFWIYNIYVFFSAPSSPRNVQLLSVTDTSIKISWWEPARANGVLLGYRVYFLHRNFTSVQTIRDNKSAMVETLTRLSKYFTQLTFKKEFYDMNSIFFDKSWIQLRSFNWYYSFEFKIMSTINWNDIILLNT